MHVHGLCFVFPEDMEENEIPDCNHVDKPRKKVSPKRGCSSQAVDFIGHKLRRVHDLRWINFCHHGVSRKQSREFHDMEGEMLYDKIGRDNPRIFSYAELYIGSGGFSQDELLGSGGFGRVYRAVLPSDGTVVAVKCVAEKGERFEKTFAAELMAVAHLRHRNLVRLRGWCVHEDELLLVYDFMPNGSLDKVLFRRPDNIKFGTLGWDRRTKIISGLATALHYLHEQLETQIIHRDVKTSNVMIDSNFNARLGDFGLARWLEHELEYKIHAPSMKNRMFRLVDTTRIGGTIGYLPPESFQKKCVATAKSDVFSFGIVVLEVVSGRRAVDLAFPDEQIILLDWIRRLSDRGELIQAGDRRLPHGSYTRLDMEHLIHIGLLCTLQSPQSRPNMKWIIEAISGDICGNLPALPSFKSEPLYISLSSESNSGTSNTTTTRPTTTSTETTGSTASSIYVTAIGETIYASAEPVDSSNAPFTNDSTKTFNFLVVETPREIPFKDIVAATNNFSDTQRVAELDFGTAYRGFLDDSHHVLVKRLGMTKCPAVQVRFTSELQNLGRLRHRNLIQLLGWCTEQGEMLVVYDYMASHLLSHILFHHDKKSDGYFLRWNYRYNIIKSLASAILYLHEEWEEQVIHRNITSSAIVLDADMNPRLTSFALAEFLTRNDNAHHAAANKNNSVRGIFGYIAPEYTESGKANTMTDIYSFGIVVLEVVSGQMAVDFRRPEVLLVRKVQDFEEHGRPLEELADLRLNGEYNKTQLGRLINLGIACTRSDPRSRPTMRQILSILDGNDKFFQQGNQKFKEEWKKSNASSLSLIKRVQALGIQ